MTEPGADREGVDIVADLSQQDGEGRVWTRWGDVTRPCRIWPGAIALAGLSGSPWWARVVEVAGYGYDDGVLLCPLREGSGDQEPVAKADLPADELRRALRPLLISLAHACADHALAREHRAWTALAPLVRLPPARLLPSFVAREGRG